MSTIKAGLVSLLLLVVFSLPGITATQLVSVLGESVVNQDVKTQILGDKGTFIQEQSGKFTISVTQGGTHPVLRLINPNPVAKSVRLTPLLSRDAALLSQSIDLTSAQGSLRLYDHSVQPFNSFYEVILKPYESLNFNLLPVPDKGAPSYATISLEVH